MRPKNESGFTTAKEDDDFWHTAAQEIRDGEVVTICRGGRVFICETLKGLWRARATLEGRNSR